MKSPMISRRQLLSLAGMGGAALLAGCSRPDTPGSTVESGGSSSKLKKVRFALDWTPNTNHTGIYVAAKRGYFAQAGLDVEILQAPENGADALVAAGDAEFGVSFADSIAGYISSDKPLPVKAIAAIVQHNTSGIISLKDKGIDRPSKMVGASYASWELPIELAVLKHVVTKDGGDFNRVNIIPSTVTDEVSALSTNQVDCIWVYWGWAGVKCELEGLDVNYFAFRDLDPLFDYYSPVIISNDKLINNDANLVQSFVDAARQGYEDCIKDPDACAEVLLEAAPELDKKLVRASQRYLSEQYQADAKQWGMLDQKRWDAFLKWVGEQGIVPAPALGAGMTDKFVLGA
ncbi:ABC transporter substrate-binding protein [Collinsella sp. zg1085]|uniref:ABC transporter substrate-binding protein n=1 Tax=Collinsella sp. zg1085 TaxID=2844380 RepID=UPI001C0AE0EF|nr:ABC transporter substrate-binding protein [Collinsella sp. zg1085]QWT17424.1 ABC transporter substrate-binding protein [Collinsella sp. zg1085]